MGRLDFLGIYIIGIALFGSGCGGVQKAEHEVFRQVQQEEAIIAQNERIGAADCGDCAAKAQKICEASQRICDVAEEYRDADLEARCRRAKERCPD